MGFSLGSPCGREYRANVPAVRSPTKQIALSVCLLSAWLTLLMLGWNFGGAVYLLLVGSLAVFPWKMLRQ